METVKLLVLIFILLSCNIEKEIESEIKYMKNIPMSQESININCTMSNRGEILRITNHHLTDAIIILRPSLPNIDCYQFVRAYYFKKIQESLLLESKTIGDIDRNITKDTISPQEYMDYILDRESIELMFKSNLEIDYIQLYYPYELNNSNTEEYYFRILFHYDRNTDELTQMQFTIPDKVHDFVIPSN